MQTFSGINFQSQTFCRNKENKNILKTNSITILYWLKKREYIVE